MQTNPVWRMIRALIVTYILSGIFLAALSFALFKFRLPEDQVNLAVYAVYILSCFFGGIIAGKAMRTRRFFWGLVLGILYFLFLYLMSSPRRTASQRTPTVSSPSSPCVPQAAWLAGW